MHKQPPSFSYLSPARPRVLAHRGFAHANSAIENTIDAFKAALELGATHIESDIQVTSDGVAVLFHDDDLMRVAGLPQKVSQLTAQQLRDVDLGAGARIPTLAEALEQLPMARFNLDFKVLSAVAAAAKDIKAANAEGRILVASFSERRRKLAVEALTTNAVAAQSIASSAGSARVLALWVATKFSADWLVRLLTREIAALQIPTSSAGLRFDSPAFISKIKATGCEIHYWTVNEVDEMTRLNALGADGIVTDRTDIAVNTLLTAR